ncbi:MAG: hypothetical protein OEQ13_01280 [Acidobacteriota bacterium]|nr:hypothetical protein [Acidobacteriota bacterium]
MSSASSGRSGRKLLRTLLTFVLMTAFAASALYAIGSGIANRKKADVIAAWDGSLGTEDEIFERYPHVEANTAALDIERLSAVLGVDIAPKQYDGRARPTDERSREYGRVKPQVANFLQKSLSRPGAGLSTPPETLAAFFEAHDEEIGALRSVLAAGDLPRWEMHVEELWEAPIPNLLGHITLQRLLLAHALVSAAGGDRDTALADLDASWRLNASLRDSPILISQLIAVAVARMQVGMLRHVDGVPASWRERLAEHDHRASLMESLRYEGWIWTKFDDPELIGMESTLQRVALRVAQPYVRYCLFDTSDRWRHAIERLAEGGQPCGVPTNQAELHDPAPGWNIMERIVVPNLLGAVDRVARLEIDIELTDRWLALQQLRDENRGAWPAGIAEPEPSAACPGEHWIYAVSESGEASVNLSRELRWPGQVGLILPTRHSSAKEPSDT